MKSRFWRVFLHIVFALINCVCLFIELDVPEAHNIWKVVPAVISILMFVIGNDSDNRTRSKILSVVAVAIAALIIIVHLVLPMIAEIVPNINGHGYLIVGKPNSSAFSDLKLSYLAYQWIITGLIVVVHSLEIFVSYI